MNRFFLGSALGLMAGAGLMMMPGAQKMHRSAMKEADKLRKQLRRM